MALELHPFDNGGATLWAAVPVNVTILRVGSRKEGRPSHRYGGERYLQAQEFEQRVLDGSLVRLNRTVNDPNGNPSFLGVIKGLPVVGYMPWTVGDRSGALFRTPGGSIVQVTAQAVPLPENLDDLAERAGLFEWQRRQRELDIKMAIMEADAIVAAEREAPPKLTYQERTADPNEEVPLGDLTDQLRAQLRVAHITAYMRADGQIVVHGSLNKDQREDAKGVIRAWRDGDSAGRN